MLYNETKNRKATPNESAKFILLQRLQSKLEFLAEDFYLEDIKLYEDEVDERGWSKPTKELQEIQRHFEKHYDSLVNRLLNGDVIRNR